jgi:hypothetical protein
MKPYLLAPLLLALSLVAARADDLPPDSYPGIRGPDGKLIPSVAAYLGKDVHTLTLTVSPELLKARSNFGYSDDEIKQYFSTPVKLTIDDTGLNKTFLKPPPPPGVHPRVIFNPEDLPGIRDRLAKTKAGQVIFAAIKAHIADTLTGDKAKFRADYDALAAGTVPADKLDGNVPFTMLYEAFRCLVEDDKVGGQKVAAAITTLSQVTQRDFDANLANPRNANSKNDFQSVAKGPTFEGTLGLDYDFAYNFMTDDQRKTVRQVIVNTTTGMTGLGCETLRTLHTGTSNWISWNARALFLICAIEGEPGYDKSTYDRFANSETNFIASMYPTGEAFEGWGKDFMFVEHMIIVAKRNPELSTLGYANARSAYNNYFMSMMSPWGGNFTFCDSLASSGCKIARNADVLMYHALLPDDLAVDFVFRNQIEGDYDRLGEKNINTHHPFAVMDELCCAIFATDLKDISWDDEYAKLTADRPLTYFSEDTCNMATRSGWSKDALYLNYLNRAIPGGHQYCDRSHFSLYGNGRFWSIYHYARQIGEQYKPLNRSVLLADGEGASVAPAQCVAFVDQPKATFEATDLSLPWNFQSTGLQRPAKGETTSASTFNYNQFRLHPSPLPWMSLATSQLPDWYTSEKPDPAKAPQWYQRLTVKKAFRTVGLVRGAHPYSLIVDDLQLDDQSHHYDWGMILPDDVVLGSATATSTTANAAGADITLNENPKPDPKATAPPETDRHLLVRVLSASQLTDPPAVVDTLTLPNPPQRNMEIPKLHVTSDSVSPDFKMLLFSYKEGDTLPTTTWSADHKSVTIAWPDQSDVVTLTPGADGRTHITVVRGGATLAAVN